MTCTNNTKTLSVNTETFALTEYTNYGFNSMTHFRGKDLGIISGIGIFELTGATDNGTNIASKIKTSLTDIYSDAIERIRKVWINYKSSGAIKLTTTEDEGTPFSDTLPTTGITKYQERMAKMGRGLKGRFYEFEIANVSNSTFELDRIKILTETLSKRR